MLSSIMQDEFPFTALEYAKMLGISKECLRGRRRSGKLEGEYTVKDNCYFYKRVRPDQLLSTPKNPPKRVRRRGAHNHGQTVHYPNNAFRQHNEAKMMAKLKYNIDDETLSLLPEAILKAKEAKAERIKEAYKPYTGQRTNNYGSGIYACGSRGSVWKSLEPKKVDKGPKYY